jgi:hypothetical protein
VNVPPPNETVVSSLNRLLEGLEQMEQFLRQLAAEVLPEEVSTTWAITNRVCDRYRIPRAA